MRNRSAQTPSEPQRTCASPCCGCTHLQAHQGSPRPSRWCVPARPTVCPMQLEGTMEYLAAILGLGALCGCALGAYVLFEGIEREQEEDRARVAERALRPAGATLWPPVQLVYPPPDGRGWLARARLDGQAFASGDDAETRRAPADAGRLPQATSLESVQEQRRQRWGGVAAHAARLDERVRGLEDRFRSARRIRAAVVEHPQPALLLRPSSPNGIRTRVSTLRGWCPRPLDDGTGSGRSAGLRHAV